MVRAERQVPNVYFGRPGSLVSMPWPRGDLDKPYDRQTFDFVTGSGQHLTSMASLGSRPYTVTWNALHVDNFKAVEQYWNGAMGVGPWAFIDPSSNNLLLPNQAAATSVTNDLTGWKTETGTATEGTLFSNSNAAFIHRPGATRSIKWQFTAGPISVRPTLVAVSAYRNWPALPVVPGLPYTYSFWVISDGTDPSVSVKARIRWTDSVNAAILPDADPGYTAIGTGWQRLTVTGTAPANAYWGYPGAVVDDTTVTVGAILYVDELNFEQDSVANNWAPGTGLRPVEILQLTETVPFESRLRRGLTLTLRELAA